MKRDKFRLDFMELDILLYAITRKDVKNAFLKEANKCGHCDGDDEQIYRTTREKILNQFVYCDE